MLDAIIPIGCLLVIAAVDAWRRHDLCVALARAQRDAAQWRTTAHHLAAQLRAAHLDETN